MNTRSRRYTHVLAGIAFVAGVGIVAAAGNQGRSQAAISPDLNGDGKVGVLDLSKLLSNWKMAGGDVNGDGTTNVLDLSALLTAWGRTYPGATPTSTPTRTATPSPTRTPTPTPIATATPVAGGTSPSGQAMPTGNLTGWKQIFSDDFTTDVALGSFTSSSYKNRWGWYDDGTKDTAGQGGASSRYYPSKVLSVKNGVLDKYLHTENGQSLAAALLPKYADGSYGQLYGRFSIRAKSDSLKGYKTAWLLWPNSETWPRDGEIDFPEGDLSGTIGAFMHRQNGTSGGDQDAFSSTARYTDWHTYTTEWTPTTVKFLIDDKVIGTSTNRIPNTKMHYVMQTESCLGSCPAASTAGHLQVDWVSIYSYNP